MNKDRESIVNLMAEVFIQGNRMMCLQSGMTSEETEKRIDEGRPSITYLMGNVFDKMDENELIVL